VDYSKCPRSRKPRSLEFFYVAEPESDDPPDPETAEEPLGDDPFDRIDGDLPALRQIRLSEDWANGFCYVLDCGRFYAIH
jgi:hypothetical protein